MRSNMIHPSRKAGAGSLSRAPAFPCKNRYGNNAPLLAALGWLWDEIVAVAKFAREFRVLEYPDAPR
jgi:hypothetical protein